jgi:hypothetical protein
MKKYSVLLITCFAGFVVSCSGTQKIKEGDFVCKDHGSHRLSNRQEFADCFAMKSSDLDDSYIFSREGSAGTAAEAGAVASRLKTEAADEIVDVIVKKLEAAFGNDLSANWRLERIDLPVIFRIFTIENTLPIRVKAVAVVKKEDFAPRSLIRFLPLEYKMKLMKTNEQEMREFEKDKPKPR